MQYLKIMILKKYSYIFYLHLKKFKHSFTELFGQLKNVTASVGEGEGGMIWGNGIERSITS